MYAGREPLQKSLSSFVDLPALNLKDPVNDFPIQPKLSRDHAIAVRRVSL